ncbi:hypothetical protein C8R46DRAFT_1164342 [Mycena filopes]|nr:hypothetical protein C8R46DRAFT_1164342 [Mycena filopes]
MSESVILYRRDTSPFSWKIDNVLLLKKVPHEKVDVSRTLPRPEITDLLGLTYRRIPILAIGNDIYCDTSLIASALERRFPATRGYGTIFPKRKHGADADTGLIKAFAKHWADTVLFPFATLVLPWKEFPPAFIEDRSTVSFGAYRCRRHRRVDGEKPQHPCRAFSESPSSQTRPTKTTMNSLLWKNKEWLFNTEQPSLADISVHFVYTWIKPFSGVESLFDPYTFPKSLEWLARLTTYFARLKLNHAPVPEITGKDAAERIVAASFEPYDVVGFDAREGGRLGLNAGDEISIAPDDTGTMFATVGKLVGLNREEFVLEVKGRVGLVRCHFPRVMFTARLAANPEL